LGLKISRNPVPTQTHRSASPEIHTATPTEDTKVKVEIFWV